MSSIFLHRLKRKRIKEGRIECHGNVFGCNLLERLSPGIHKRPEIKKEIPVAKSYQGEAEFFKQKAPEKSGFFRRIFK